MISANHREIPAGLVVDEVLGFRRFTEHEYADKWPDTIVRCERFLKGAYRRNDEAWPIFDLFDFVEDLVQFCAYRSGLPAQSLVIALDQRRHQGQSHFGHFAAAVCKGQHRHVQYAFAQRAELALGFHH